MIAPETNPPPPQNADAWFTPARFALLLGALIALTFPAALFGSETFFFRDFGVFGYPLAQYHRDCFWRGQLPLWNPLNCCGLPFLAQWNTLTLYPPALVYLLLPLSWSLGVFNLAHLFVAGLGMYFLARRWTENNLAATVAGIIYAFNGLTWHSLMWPNDIAGLAWMPWVVFAIERAWNFGGRWLVRAAILGALQMLTGAPEIILLTWIFVGLLWLTQFVTHRQRLHLAARASAVIALVTGLAAAQLLPFLDLLKHSHRDPGFGGADWPMPLAGVANFIAPLFRCFQTAQGIFMQRDQYWIASYYLGGGAILLALAAIWLRPKDRRVWLLLAVTAGSVWMALGIPGHLYAITKHILPMIGFMRYPIKFVVLAVFCLPLLAAFGVSRLRADPAPGSHKIIGIITAALLIGLMVVAWLDWRYPEPYENWTVAWHNLAARAAFLVAVLALLLGLNRVTKFNSQLGLRFALLLLLWLDVYTHAPNLSPTVNRSVYEPKLIRAELKLPPPSPGDSRFMVSADAGELVRFHSVQNAGSDYLGRRLALFDDCNLLDSIPKIDGFYSLYLKESFAVMELLAQADKQGIDLKGLKDFLSIAQVNPPGTDPSRALEWMARPALPMITAGQAPVFLAETNILSALTQTNFNPAETVYLPTEARVSITARRAAAQIGAQQIGAQKISAEINSPATALVVLSQAFYHPWRAYVDDRPVKIWRANHAFQAVQVPAGRHRLVLKYEDTAFKGGAVMSLGSLLLLAIGWFYFKPRPAAENVS